jgi:hypothetical protein
MTTVSPEKSRLYTDPDYEPTLEEWNELLLAMGHAYKSELIKRTMFESELFGMNTYLVLSFLDEYAREADRLRTILAKKTPTELIGDLRVGTKRNFMGVMSFPLNYFIGRELLIDLGELKPDQNLDDHLVVLDWWRKATIAQRTDGVLLNMDADPVESVNVLRPEVLEEIVGSLADDPDEVAAARKFGGGFQAYCFLENCDSRIAVSETGPYDLGNGSYLAVRELTADRDGDFPWTDGIRDLMEHHHFAVAYELPNSVHMETNVWGTAWFTPADYTRHVTRARVFVTENGKLEPLDAERLVELRKGVRAAHRKLYERMSEMSAKERTLIASLIYTWKTKAWARAAGVYDDLEWDLLPEVASRYEEFADDAFSQAAIGAAFVPADRDGCYRPLEG